MLGPSPSSGPTEATSAARDWLPQRFVSGGLLVLLSAALALFTTLSRSGIWEPEELARAELARRIAIHVFGASSLQLAGAANHMPTLTDLGSGELGYTSMAWGLATLGLHDYAGRLPLALWALATALVLYIWLARLSSVRVGWMAALVLCSMPLFFMQARTMLGDATTMAAFLFCFAGLSGAWLDDVGHGGRTLWCLLALFGAVAGYLSRGLLLGVAAPTLGLGFSVLGWRLAAPPAAAAAASDGSKGMRARALVVGGVALAVGLCAAVVGGWKVQAAGWGGALVERAIGAALLAAPAPTATFDATIQRLGHGLFPWSALLPFALVACVRLPAAVLGARRQRQAALRISLLVGASAAYVVHGYLQPFTGNLPFVATALLAAAIAMALVDVDRRPRHMGPAALATLLLALLLARDLSTSPLKALAALGLPEHRFPVAFRLSHEPWLWAMALVFGGGLWLLLLDADGTLEGKLLPGGKRARGALGDWFQRRVSEYEAALEHLNIVWHGNLAFGFLLLEAAAVGLALTLWVGRQAQWEHLRDVPHLFNVMGFNAWWVLPLGLALAPLLFDGARVLVAWALRRSRLSRGSAALLVGVAAAQCGSLVFYPAVVGQLSPKLALEEYAQRHRPGQPLGLMGVNERVARYYTGGELVVPLATVRKAASWLLAGPAQARRWMIVHDSDIAEMNAAYRELEGNNVPVVVGRDGFPLLLSNRLAGEPDRNPLANMVLNAPPSTIQHPVVATFDGKLQLLGWDVVGEDGAMVPFVVPGQPFVLRSYYRVTGRIRRDYRAFLHIDGDGRRHNGDHPVLAGRYPMALWRVGDVVVDRYQLALTPNFYPGDYRVYLGFFRGKQRMKVTAGRHHDNRVAAGTLRVR